MDPAGGTVAALGKRALPGAYSGLAARHAATGALAHRLLDAGVERFFGEPNDLVVPTEGCFVLDRAAGARVPATRSRSSGRPERDEPDPPATSTSSRATRRS